MRAISLKMRQELEKLERMQRCAVKRLCYGETCVGRIEWHHVWIYAGRQINELWAIVGACKKHHDQVDSDPTIKNAFKIDSLLNATEKDLAKYPKADWEQRLRRLAIHDLWQQHEK